MTTHLSDADFEAMLASSMQWTILGTGGSALARAPNLQSAIVRAFELECANTVVQNLKSSDGIEIDTDQRYRLTELFKLV
jgi:hypothetical protein